MTELFLIAHVAGRGVAIPASLVDSVVDIADVVRVPRADPCVRGLAALRSRVVTVIDTGLALGLAPLGRTAPAPGLPLITATGTPPDELAALRRALQAACATPALAAVRQALLIEGFEPLDAAAWPVAELV